MCLQASQVASTGMSSQKRERPGFGRLEELYGTGGQDSDGRGSWDLFPSSSSQNESVTLCSPCVQAGHPVLLPAAYNLYGTPVAMTTYGILPHPLQQSFVAGHALQIESGASAGMGEGVGWRSSDVCGPTITHPEDSAGTTSSTDHQSTNMTSSQDQLVIVDVTEDELETSCQDVEPSYLELDPTQLEFEPSQQTQLEFEPSQQSQLEFEPSRQTQLEFEPSQQTQLKFEPSRQTQLRFEPSQKTQLEFEPSWQTQLEFEPYWLEAEDNLNEEGGL